MTNNVSPAPIAHRPLILIACMLAMFMSAIEATIVATAMPTIIGDLGGFSLLGWVFAVYLLSQAITIPIYGRLADLYGRKRVFFFGATLFLLGSVLCGFAPDMYWLIGFRLLQGLGAGAIMPIASTIIGDIYSATERPKVMGYLSSVWGVSAIIGPLLGAFIVQHLPWALVFWVNLPIGLLAMFFLWRYLPAHQPLRQHALDLAGTAWLTLFVSALLLALLQMESLGWWVVPLFALAAAALALLVRQERRAVEPLFPLALWQSRVIVAGNIGGLVIGAAMMGISAFLPTFIQGVMGGLAARGGHHAGADVDRVAAGQHAERPLDADDLVPRHGAAGRAVVGGGRPDLAAAAAGGRLAVGPGGGVYGRRRHGAVQYHVSGFGAECGTLQHSRHRHRLYGVYPHGRLGHRHRDFGRDAESQPAVAFAGD